MRPQLINEVRRVVAASKDRLVSLQLLADAIRQNGNYRWVGLYHVDRPAGLVRNVVYSGPSAPAFPEFPITKGLTGAVIAAKRTINVGDVAADPRYLTAFATTRSEIIVPVFEDVRRDVVGTIDIESASPHAFSVETEAMLQELADIACPLWTV